MQFQGLSQSFGGASLPRDSHLVQAIAAQEGDEALENDELEERELRKLARERRREARKAAIERQKARERQPSTLESFLEEGEERDAHAIHRHEEEEALLSGESDEDSDDDDYVRGTSALDTASSIQAGPSKRKMSIRSAWSRRLSVAAPANQSGFGGLIAGAPTEFTPLLGVPSTGSRKASVSTLTPRPLQRLYKGGAPLNPARKELLILTWYTIPVFLTHILEYSLLLATIFSVGHIGRAELAASSLGSMTTNVCALSLIQGLCAALDTLCSQAYSSPNPKDTSLHALRTALLSVIIIIPAGVVMFNGESILLALRQDPQVAHLAGQYLKILVFGLPGYAGFEIMRRWLQAQGLMIVPTITLVIASPINIFLNWLLVWGPKSVRIGFLGAPISTAISFNIMFLLSLIYCVFMAPRTAWSGFSWAIFKDLKPNIILGLAGFASVASEWWAWEVVGIASAYLGTANLGANSVLGTSASLLYQLPYGLCVATAVRVGNLVGAGYPHASKTSAHVALWMSVVISLLNSALLLGLKKNWGRLFSSDDVVVRIVADIMPLVGLFQLADGVTAAAMGVLRGTGLAPLGAQINLIGYWVIGIPLGLLLTFHPKIRWELYGLWTGLTVALLFTAVGAVLVISRIKWHKLVKEVHVKAEAEEEATAE